MVEIITIVAVALFFILKCGISRNKFLRKMANEFKTTADEIKSIYRPIFDELIRSHHVKVLWDWFGFFNKSEILNASSALFKGILVKPIWIRMLANKDNYWNIAFFHTIGHEIGHKTKEPLISIFHSRKGKFKNWVRECRADFYGVQFVQTTYLIDRSDVLKGIELKIAHNAPDECSRKEHKYSHPSWSFRLEMLSRYTVFGQDIIRCIAKEAGVNDERYIKKMIAKAKLDVVTKDEKNEVCSKIHEYMIYKLEEIIDDELFNCSSMEGVGEFYYHNILKEVENASEELIDVVIRHIYLRDTFEVKKDYYLKLCDYIGLKKLPHDVISEVKNEYQDIFVTNYSALLKRYRAELNSLNTQLQQQKNTGEKITKASLKPNILEGLSTKENLLYESYTVCKQLQTRKEMLEFENKFLNSKLLEFCDFNNQSSVDSALKKEALHLCKEISYDAKFAFSVYREYIEIAEDHLDRPYAIFFKVKYFPILSAAQKKHHEQVYSNRDEALNEYEKTLKELPTVDTLHHQKTADLSSYKQSLDQLIDSNNIVGVILDRLQNSVCLRNRRDILIDAIELFNQSKYDLFNNILPIQIEGMFADYLYDTTTFDRFTNINLHFDAVLKQKIGLLQEVKSDIYPEAVEYFRFYFNNLVRNKIAHGRYNIKSENAQNEIFAKELLLDLNMLVYMLSRNSETEKMCRFVQNYQQYYSKLTKEQNPCFGALFNDLIGAKIVSSCDTIEKYTPMQVAYWLVNPHYEEIYKNVVNDNQLISLRNIFFCSDFWAYVDSRLDSVIKAGYDFLSIHSQTASVVNALFRCNVSDDTKNHLKNVASKLKQVKSMTDS